MLGEKKTRAGDKRRRASRKRRKRRSSKRGLRTGRGWRQGVGGLRTSSMVKPAKKENHKTTHGALFTELVDPVF